MINTRRFLKLMNKIINKVIFTTPPFLGSIEATYNLIIGKSKLFKIIYLYLRNKIMRY